MADLDKNALEDALKSDPYGDQLVEVKSSKKSN
jgi:hypothetical protein